MEGVRVIDRNEANSIIATLLGGRPVSPGDTIVFGPDGNWAPGKGAGSKEGYFATYYYVKDYGAIGDGVTDDTQAIKNTVAAATETGGVVFFHPGEYLITENIDVPRQVFLKGSGARSSVLMATSQKSIIMRGSGGWGHLIEGLMFDAVNVRYGTTPNDFGNGATIRSCEFTNSIYGVEYVKNCWQTLIDDCKFYNCLTGVLFNFAAAGSNSGAAMRISSSGIFDCVTGVFIDGITTDGCSIMISRTDIENCALNGILATNLGDGTLVFSDGHLEFAGRMDYAITSYYGNIFVNNVWCFPANTSNIALFRLYTGCRLWLSKARLQWDMGKLAEMHGGILFLDADSIFTNQVLFGKYAAPKATNNSTGGFIVNGGCFYPAYETWGKIATGTFAGAGGIGPLEYPPEVLSVIRAFDVSPRTFQFTFNSLLSSGSGHWLRVQIADGMGSPWVDVPIPVADGSGEIWLTLGYNSLRVHGFFIDNSTNKAYSLSNQIFFVGNWTTDRYVQLYKIIHNGGALWWYSNLREDVH